MPSQSLDTTTIRKMLDERSGWTLEDGEKAISRTFRFENFPVAFGFMAEMAVIAEEMDHHPEWSNVWNKVSVRLTTHDAGGLTELDFTLAAHMDAAAARHGSKQSG